ncbi:MAG: DUF2110 family protein [Candidatus Jordarchaeales archaeon]
MTCKITLLERVYGADVEDGLKSARMLLKKDFSELNVAIKEISLDDKGRLVVTLEGEDEEAAKNFLAQRYGCTRSLSELKEGGVYRGHVVNPLYYGYGFYVDIGVVHPAPKDALVPLYKLRKQLVGDRKVPLRMIARAFCFVENLPVEVKVVKVDPARNKIEAELSEKEIERLNEWVKSKFDRVVVCGATRQQVRRAIIKSGHLRDIVAIERLGLMEHAIVCKYGTDAPGIIAEVGDYLRNATLRAFIPEEVRKIISSAQPETENPTSES